MPASTEPNSGLYYGFTPGESGWGDEMDANLLAIGRLAFPNLHVLDRDATDPSLLTPSSGDKYIVGPSSIGDWVGQDGKVAVYDGSAWVFYTPSAGWLCCIVDEEVVSMYKTGTGWSAGVSI